MLRRTGLLLQPVRVSVQNTDLGPEVGWKVLDVPILA